MYIHYLCVCYEFYQFYMCRFLQQSEVYSTLDTCQDTVASLKLPVARHPLSLLYSSIKGTISSSSQSCISSSSDVTRLVLVEYSKEEGLREYNRFDYLITGKPRSVYNI